MIRISFLNEVIINNYQTILIYPIELSVRTSMAIQSFEYDSIKSARVRLYTILSISCNHSRYQWIGPRIITQLSVYSGAIR